MREYIKGRYLLGMNLDTSILNYYFKRVSVDFSTYDKINQARRKMGFLK